MSGQSKDHFHRFTVGGGIYDLAYIETVITGDLEESARIEDEAANQGYGPAVKYTTVSNFSAQKAFCCIHYPFGTGWKGVINLKLYQDTVLPKEHHYIRRTLALPLDCDPTDSDEDEELSPQAHKNDRLSWSAPAETCFFHAMQVGFVRQPTKTCRCMSTFIKCSAYAPYTSFGLSSFAQRLSKYDDSCEILFAWSILIGRARFKLFLIMAGRRRKNQAGLYSKAFCWEKTRMLREIWEARDNSNLIETVHQDANLKVVQCTLVGGLKKGQQFDAMKMKTLQSHWQLVAEDVKIAAWNQKFQTASDSLVKAQQILEAKSCQLMAETDPHKRVKFQQDFDKKSRAQVKAQTAWDKLVIRRASLTEIGSGKVTLLDPIMADYIQL
ncbi:hypothetical protein K438DRAFT_1760144 [Mycena galopus ATCC 62051]|nr:hypothetical protein K438DRAFT_1760144 [Mycena galopus ATCC 62051]